MWANVIHFDDFIDLVCIPGLQKKEQTQIHSLPFIISFAREHSQIAICSDLWVSEWVNEWLWWRKRTINLCAFQTLVFDKDCTYNLCVSCFVYVCALSIFPFLANTNENSLQHNVPYSNLTFSYIKQINAAYLMHKLSNHSAQRRIYRTPNFVFSLSLSLYVMSSIPVCK